MASKRFARVHALWRTICVVVVVVGGGNTKNQKAGSLFATVDYFDTIGTRLVTVL